MDTSAIVGGSNLVGAWIWRERDWSNRGIDLGSKISYQSSTQFIYEYAEERKTELIG